MLEVTLTTDQKVTARINPRTMTGAPLPFDGGAEWGIVSGDGTVESADDGMSAELYSSDIPGITVYLVVIDIDLGNGVEEISDLIMVTSVHPNAQAMGVVIGPTTRKT